MKGQTCHVLCVTPYRSKINLYLCCVIHAFCSRSVSLRISREWNEAKNLAATMSEWMYFGAFQAHSMALPSFLGYGCADPFDGSL